MSSRSLEDPGEVPLPGPCPVLGWAGSRVSHLFHPKPPPPLHGYSAGKSSLGQGWRDQSTSCSSTCGASWLMRNLCTCCWMKWWLQLPCAARTQCPWNPVSLRSSVSAARLRHGHARACPVASIRPSPGLLPQRPFPSSSAYCLIKSCCLLLSVASGEAGRDLEDWGGAVRLQRLLWRCSRWSRPRELIG